MKKPQMIYPHWHEGVEVLNCMEGKGEIIIDCNKYVFEKGDTVVINSNCLHTITPLSDEMVEYYCFIAGEEFCENFGFQLSEVYCRPLIRDGYISEFFGKIAYETEKMPEYYKAAVTSLAIDMFVYLLRNYISTAEETNEAQNSKKIMVKKAIKYIKKNYMRPLSIDEIAEKTGFSRYYFCHSFKEMTGRSVINYINLIKCMNAKSLILSEKYSISETALICGFDNFSYFSKTYKKYMGQLPSEEFNKA